MRIWAFPHIYPYDYPGLNWAGTFSHRQYQGLIASGAELNVIVPVLWHPIFPFSELHKEWKQFRLYNYPKHRVYDGINVYHPRINNYKPNRFVKGTYRERYANAIINFFKDRNIELNPHTDIFYSQWLPSAVFVQDAAHKLGIKSAILGIGDDVIVEPLKKESNIQEFKQLLLEADARFYNADYLGKEANKIAGLNTNYTVTYFGVDYNLFKPASEIQKKQLRAEYHFPADKIIILTVASPLVRKGWLDLFDALEIIKNETIDFVLVGGYAGPKDIEIVMEIENRGLKPYFIDLGEVKPETLSKLYNTADIFCLPSHWEGLPTVVMESMACGLAVLSTNVCGIPEIVTTGETGILVPTKRVDLLTKELLLLIKDKGKRKILGNNARKFIVDIWGNANDNAAKLYKKFEETIA